MRACQRDRGGGGERSACLCVRTSLVRVGKRERGGGPRDRVGGGRDGVKGRWGAERVGDRFKIPWTFSCLSSLFVTDFKRSVRGLNVRPFVRSQTPASSHTSRRVHLLNVQGSVWDKPIDRTWILLSTFPPSPPLSLWDKPIDRTWILLSTFPPPSLSLFGTNLLIVPGFYSLRSPPPLSLSLWDKPIGRTWILLSMFPPPPSLSLWDKPIYRTWILLSTPPPPPLFGTNLLIVPGFYSLRPPPPLFGTNLLIVPGFYYRPRLPPPPSLSFP